MQLTRFLRCVAGSFVRQMKHVVVAPPDLAQRTEGALAEHLAAFARNVAAAQLPRGAPDGRSGRGRSAPADVSAGPVHEWRLCVWEAPPPPPGQAFAAEAEEPPLPVGERSAVRVLFALRRAELEATLGAAAVAAWQAGSVFLGTRASTALSAAQWRLEGFRPAARPPGLRASGEAPPGWAPPASRAADADR
jgi:hypothetical protein